MLLIAINILENGWPRVCDFFLKPRNSTNISLSCSSRCLLQPYNFARLIGFTVPRNEEEANCKLIFLPLVGVKINIVLFKIQLVIRLSDFNVIISGCYIARSCYCPKEPRKCKERNTIINNS